MSTDRWMDNEVVIHKYNGILLSHKKEHIWVSSNKVDELRHYIIQSAEAEVTILCIPRAQRENLRATGEGGNRGWDVWMASLTQWAIVWANSEK